MEIEGEIWNRADFGLMCEWYGLYRCVEVGVDRGDFADIFMRRCYNCQLYLGVDPYRPYDGMPWDRESDYHAAMSKFERHGSGKILRMDSSTAIKCLRSSAERFYSEPFGFVYIDAGHTAAEVFEQMNQWWPMVADGGILAGHDWKAESGDLPGVAEAVRRFAAIEGRTIYYTWKDDPQSWYIWKTGRPTKIVRRPEGCFVGERE